jgi:hypothetical protein
MYNYFDRWPRIQQKNHENADNQQGNN